ncbi:hypothetical protein [Moraxella porci]|uniref:hypothetical protein n=1 Tax=Moraxella porci TaxID=1288392 RepID=UPI00244A3187|nr:hypothetical protein [Moraxella porci]MDH2272493.1 hypothetical protein [Moraxella porci]
MTACGGDNSNRSAPALTVGEGQTSIAATGTAPADKDTLVIVNGAEASSLDPQKSQDTVSSAIIRQMFDGLVSTDAEGKTVPGLAENGKLRTIKSGHSPCAMPNGQTVIRSQLMMQYMPCVAW